jgi:fatty-acyl-CoA synthase
MNVNWISDSVMDPLPTGDPEAIAVSIDGTQSWSYRNLAERTEKLASGLLALGVRKGDRVGILLRNCLDYFALYFAVARLGAIAVRMNWRLAPSELEYVLDDSGCGVLCFDTWLSERVAAVRGDRQLAFVAFESGPNSHGVPAWAMPSPRSTEPGSKLPDIEVGSDDPVALMYTSGTTGRPKAAIWTHGNTLWHAALQAMKFHFDERTVALTTGPFYHAGAFEVLLMPALLRRGTAVGMASGNFTIDRLVDVIRRMRVTDALLYPFMLYDLLRHPACTPDVLGSLRRIVCGGDAVMPWAPDALGEKLPGVDLVVTYGLTEGGGNATYLDYRDLRGHPASVGRPLPLTRVKVVGADGNVAAPGEVGEVWVRGPAVSPGYWGKPQETMDTFAGGWCRTGDLGSVSDDGFLTITGRLKDMIRSGGENIYPAEVEAVLTGHPHVADAAVVGVPDPRYLEVGCAFVVLHRDASVTSHELAAYCRERLAGYKVPHHWLFVEELPRNAAGKVAKTQLREDGKKLLATP